MPQLETESRLKLSNPARQSSSRNTETRIVRTRAVAERVERGKIQVVKEVKEVKPQVKPRGLPQESIYSSQANTLRDRDIDVKITRPAEHVAADAGNVCQVAYPVEGRQEITAAARRCGC